MMNDANAEEKMIEKDAGFSASCVMSSMIIRLTM